MGQKLKKQNSITRGRKRINTNVKTHRNIAGQKKTKILLEHRTKQLEILTKANLQINTDLETTKILRSLVSFAMKLTNAESGTTGLVISGHMVFKEYNKKGKIFPIDYSFKKGYGVPGWVMIHKKPYVTNDTENDKNVVPEIRKALAFYNLADVPILNRKGKLLGCFEIHNTKGKKPFEKNDIEMLEALAADAAIALENAETISKRKRTEIKLREREKHSQSLLRLSKKLERAQNYSDIINAAYPEIKKIMGYKNLWVYLFTDEKKYAKVLSANGPISSKLITNDKISTLQIKGDLMLEEIAEAEEIVVVEDARTDPRTNKEIVAILKNRTIVNVPIFLEKRHLGSVGTGTFGNEGIRIPTKAEKEYLSSFASHLAVSLDRVNLLDQRKQTQEALRENEKFLSNVVENIPAMIFIKDAKDLKFVKLNKAGEQLLGYKESYFLGKNDYNFFSQSQADFFTQKDREVLKKKKLSDIEEESIETKSGERILYTKKIPILNKKGKPVYLLGISEDITEQKETKNSLVQQLRFANTLNEIANVIISNDDRNIILQKMADYMGIALNVDRCLIYDISFNKNLVIGLSEWLNPAYTDIEPTKNEYPIDIFKYSAAEVRKTKRWLVSDFDNINPFLTKEGSGKILHEIMNIKSLLWFPFSFYEGGFYILVLNATHQKRNWTKIEMEFLNSASKQVSIALEKITLLAKKKQAEKAKHLSEQRLITFLNATSEMSSIKDSQFRYTFVNETLAKSFNKSVEEIIGKSVFDLLPLESAKVCQVSEEMVVKKLKSISAEETHQGRYFDTIKFPLAFENGEIGIGGFYHDVTERKIAELKLKEQKEFFNKTIESLTHPFYVIDANNYSIVMANSASNFNFSQGEIFCYELTHQRKTPCTSNGCVCPLENMRELKQPVTVEHIHTDKNGHKNIFEIHGYPILDNDGNLVQMIEYSLNITKRKQAEEALRKSEEQYRIIAENTVDTITIMDLDFNIKYKSPSIKKLLGYTVEEALSLTIDQILTPGSLLKTKNVLDEQLKLENEKGADINRSVLLELEEYRKDGSIIWVELAASFLRDEHQKPIGIISVTRDITKRKETEKALLESQKYSLSLLRLSKKIELSHSYEEVLDNALVEIHYILGYKNLWVYQFSEDKSSAKVLFAKGPVSDDLLTNGFATVKDPLYEVITGAKGSFIIKDAQTDQLIDKEIAAKRKYRTIVNIPINLFGKHSGWIGTGTFGNEGIKVPTDPENDFLTALAGYIAVALDRIHLTNERKQAIKALRYSFQRYETLFNKASDGIVIISPTGKIISVNESFAAVHGYSIEEMMKKEIRDLNTPETEQFSHERMKRILAGEQLNFQVEHFHRKGHIITLEVTVGKIIIGNEVIIQSINRDITAKVAAEAEFRKLSEAIEHSPVSIIITNKEAKIEYVNPKFCEVTGYSFDEVIKQNPRILKSGEQTNEFYKNLWETILSGNNWAGIFKNKKKNGELFWESANISPIKNDKDVITHFVCVKEDITEKVEKENELRKYQEHLEELVEEKTEQVIKQNIFFRNLIDTIPNPVFVEDEEYRFTEANKAFEEFFNTTREEVLGKTIYDFVPKDIADRSRNYDEQLIKSHNTVVYESLAPDINGGKIPMLIYKSSFGLPDNKPEGITALMIDISKQKEMEKTTLEALKKEKELNEMKTNFISMASHEFRTPLTTILASTDLLEMYHTKWSEEKNTSHFKKIQDSVINMTSLLDEVLTLSRSDRGKIVFSPTTQNLNDFCIKIIEEVRPQLSDKHKLLYNFNLPFQDVLFDSKLLSHVLINLLTNAIKFSPDGGNIELSVENGTDFIKFIIKDNGIGIPEDDVNKLFEPFFRAQNSVDIEGTGLGLSIVKRYVELQHGEIFIKSKLGRGTKIIIKINL